MKSFAFPGNIEPEILSIGSTQIPYMRTKEFSEIMLESEKMLLELIDCDDGKLISYTASGTAAMDSCLISFVSKCKKALVIKGGTFGKRWSDMCSYYNISHDDFAVEPGKDPDWDLLESMIKSKKYDVLLTQHHETSSGYIYNIERISKICSENKLVLIVDAISSFLTDYISMKKFGIDIAILSSQKGLNLPPGLSFIILSDKIIHNSNFEGGCYYYDWGNNLENLKRGQTPYSSATQIYLQLHQRLKQVKEKGLQMHINEVKGRANFFRKLCLEKGWKLSAEVMSNCLTGIYLPFNVKPLVIELNKKEIYVMPSSVDNLMRISHSGILKNDDYVELINEIDKWEQKL